jgi:cytochrome c peroxidase
MIPFTLKRFTLTSLMMLAAAGCGGQTPDEQPLVEDPQAEETWDAEQHATLASTVQGAYLFTQEKFGGNGRTCSTCHTLGTGTLTPSQVQAAWSRNHNDPLFRGVDSDTGDGAAYTKLLKDATFVVGVPLAANVRAANNPSPMAFLRRRTPSTLDAPRFDPVVMLDGREPNLQSQATHAIFGHAQGTRPPTDKELNSIVDFERVLFSSAKMANYAVTGQAPALPTGNTASEKRGAAFFAPNALCGSCHGGPLLNTMTAFNPEHSPAGTRFASAMVSELNFAGNPAQEWIFTNPDGTQTHVVSPDPGRALLTGNLQDLNKFRMVSLRNIKNTAPYFHDNSAKTLEAVMVQYKALADIFGIPMSAQDMADMTAYMKLL